MQMLSAGMQKQKPQRTADRADRGNGKRYLLRQGTGEAAVFGIPLTERYDDIKSIGGDYFIAKKYVNTDGDILGAPQEYEISRQIGFF